MCFFAGGYNTYWKKIHVKVNLNNDFSLVGTGSSKILSKYFWIVKKKKE